MSYSVACMSSVLFLTFGSGGLFLLRGVFMNTCSILIQGRFMLAIFVANFHMKYKMYTINL